MSIRTKPFLRLPLTTIQDCSKLSSHKACNPILLAEAIIERI